MTGDVLSLAKNYPYPILKFSYLFENDHISELSSSTRLPSLKNRSPVLAVGSNQSPLQLSRKFSGKNWGPIPVLRARLHDFDAAYSPHITGYGAIPATLQDAKNSKTTFFINWLDDAQLNRMHETEMTGSNYSFGVLTDLNIEVETGPCLEEVFTYTSKHGVLCDPDGPIFVAEIESTNPSRSRLTQFEVQTFARDKISQNTDIDQFILSSINDPKIRRQRSRKLKLIAQNFKLNSFKEVLI